MKRIISLTLAILLIAAGLVACDNAEGGEDTSAVSSGEDTSIHSIIEDTKNDPDVTIAPGDNTSASETVIPESSAVVSPETTGGATLPVTEPEETTPVTEPVTTPTTEPATEPETTAPAAPETEPPHVHSYGDWEVTLAATCTDFGERVRRCSCGDTLREDILPTDHNFVDGVCTICGLDTNDETLELRLIENFEYDSILFSTPYMIVFKRNGMYYIAGSEGDVISRGYTGALCVSSDDYVVMYDTLSIGVTDIESEDDEYVGLKETTTLLACYVLDCNGNELFSTRYTYTTRDLGPTTYEGEYIASCNEERIITYTPETYYFASAYSPMTVNIYDMSGTKLATFDNVRSVGTLIDGEILMLVDGSFGDANLIVTNKNGKVLRTGSSGILQSIAFFPANYWTTHGFISGYAILTDDTSFYNSYLTMLVSQDLETSYAIRSEYLYEPQNYGSIVASKIIENGVVSDKYYLVDLTRCALDSNGYCVPTIDAAVSSEGFDVIAIQGYFNKNNIHALVSRDGKWGYISLLGGEVHMFDDAGDFFYDRAIVLENGSAYVIDYNMEQISNTIEGVTGLSSSGCGIYKIKMNDKQYIAVYN